MPATHNHAHEADHKASEAGQGAADKAGLAAQAMTDEAARVGEQTVRAGADAVRRGVETARDAMQASLDTAAQSFQRITDQFVQTLGFHGPQAEDLARQSSQNLQAVSQASTVLTRGVQDVSREWAGLAQERLNRNMEALDRLARSRSVQDMVAIQSDLARDALQQVIDANRRVAQVSLRAADEAARIIQAQAENTRRAA